jgi:hypothetical protein
MKQANGSGGTAMMDEGRVAFPPHGEFAAAAMRMHRGRSSVIAGPLMRSLSLVGILCLSTLGGAQAQSLLSQQQALAKAISVLRGDPYGKTNAQVARNIKQSQLLPDGKGTPCGALNKPVWQFHVVVVSPEHQIDGYLVLDARSGKMVCANLPLLD